MHDPDFLRLAYHAKFRLWAAGFCAVVVEPETYRWPADWQWEWRLGDEPARLSSWPLVSVAAMVPPKSYEQFAKAASAEAQQTR